MRSNREKGFVPALGYSYDWLLRGYDTLLALSRLGWTFKREVVRAAALSGQERIADIGCGTGVLLREAVISHPGLSIVGVDPDERILRIARRSMPARASQRVTLQREYAHGLSFEDRSFDVCFSTLTFHHLSLSQKRQAAAEMHRVLDQDGRAIIADFRSVRFPFFSKFFIFENAEYLRQNFQGAVREALVSAGFSRIEEIRRPFSLVSIFIAWK